MKILFCGSSGRMGKATCELVKNIENAEICCGVDLYPDNTAAFPVYTSINEVKEHPDVIIDFSNHTLLPDILSFAMKNKIPCVICTTGHSLDELAIMKNISAKIPVFYSRNMSLGINLLIELSKKAASLLGQDYNIEIIEKHHNQKLDAPSGTALMIADKIKDAVSYDAEYVYGRHDTHKKREPNEIGIHAVRAGTIVGEHSVIFGGPEEVITLSHSALSRSVFANGALRAASFLIGKPAGLYDMSDLINEKLPNT